MYNLKVYKSSQFNVITLKGSFWEHEYSDECMAEPTLVFSAIEDESDKIEIKIVMWMISIYGGKRGNICECFTL